MHRTAGGDSADVGPEYTVDAVSPADGLVADVYSELAGSPDLPFVERKDSAAAADVADLGPSYGRWSSSVVEASNRKAREPSIKCSVDAEIERHEYNFPWTKEPTPSESRDG